MLSYKVKMVNMFGLTLMYSDKLLFLSDKDFCGLKD